MNIHCPLVRWRMKIPQCRNCAAESTFRHSPLYGYPEIHPVSDIRSSMAFNTNCLASLFKILKNKVGLLGTVLQGRHRT